MSKKLEFLRELLEEIDYDTYKDYEYDRENDSESPDLYGALYPIVDKYVKEWVE